jgi:hypothetical protein
MKIVFKFLDYILYIIILFNTVFQEKTCEIVFSGAIMFTTAGRTLITNKYNSGIKYYIKNLDTHRTMIAD